ncbi:MBL fold metallo-hydrolase [Fodinicola acaciae]|uniref:MBL fold metallo-hydrolase n=1 Tax=Fodinicola acaciae TaxID=2681555 RepID=UPI0013D43832|nr:MBL fold metallo-hydrolase [Fodinicola acaciae]
METVALLPNLCMVRFPRAQVYLWHEAASLTLIDTGMAGSARSIADAIRRIGRQPEEVTRVVVTHAHPDHVGSVAEIAEWNGAEVCAHRLDAPVVRGDLPMPPPVLTDHDRPLYGSLVASAGIGPSAPAAVDRELEDGDVLDFGGGAQVIWGPGHTAGSIGIYLPKHGVLFTGDTAANVDANVMLGVFNQDRPKAIESFHRLAELDVDTACFGHGDAIVGGAAARMQAAVGLVRD